MTIEANDGIGPWAEPSFVAAWVDQDRRRTLLELPRRISAAVVASDGAPVDLVVDLAAGAGAFLAVFLDRFETARGVWFDGSDAMEERARLLLAPFGDRVTFVQGDMRELGDLRTGADVVVSSRASHHLDDAELERFYVGCARLLRPGGWIANLDHTGIEGAWARRWRVARDEVTAGQPRGVAHPHREPLAALGTHLALMGAAGFEEVEVVWRALQTVLVMGRAP